MLRRVGWGAGKGGCLGGFLVKQGCLFVVFMLFFLNGKEGRSRQGFVWFPRTQFLRSDAKPEVNRFSLLFESGPAPGRVDEVTNIHPARTNEKFGTGPGFTT